MPRGGVHPAARDVGTILAVTPTGHLTVRAAGPDVPPEGTLVRDSRGFLRGKIVRVFGPVARPYLSVRPRRSPSPSEGLALLGTSLVRE